MSIEKPFVEDETECLDKSDTTLFYEDESDEDEDEDDSMYEDDEYMSNESQVISSVGGILGMMMGGLQSKCPIPDEFVFDCNELEEELSRRFERFGYDFLDVPRLTEKVIGMCRNVHALTKSYSRIMQRRRNSTGPVKVLVAEDEKVFDRIEEIIEDGLVPGMREMFTVTEEYPSTLYVFDVLLSPIERERRGEIYSEYILELGKCYDPSAQDSSINMNIRVSIIASQIVNERRMSDSDVRSRAIVDYVKFGAAALANDNFDNFEKRILEKSCPYRVKLALYKRLRQIESDDRPRWSEETAKYKSWMDCALQIPFTKHNIAEYSNEYRTEAISKMAKYIDERVYGNRSLKEQILAYANARLSNPDMKTTVLGLVGPPGVGKTTIAQILGECLGVPFTQISCGGIRDVDSIRGHSFTYLGSKCGFIAEALIRLQCTNGVILFDEFEKISRDDISSVMLHILDPMQNNEFVDNYLGHDVPLDLSSIFFVLSMNSLPENAALRDRIYPIFVKGYNVREKIEISRRHLIPRHLTNMRIPQDSIVFEDCALSRLANVSEDTHCSRDDEGSGVRGLNNLLLEVIMKVYLAQTIKMGQRDTNLSFSNHVPLDSTNSRVVVTRELVDNILPDVCRGVSSRFPMMYT